MTTEDLMNGIDKLQQDKSKFDGLDNPLIALLTHQWYNSDSYRLPYDNEINWEKSSEIGYISLMAKNIAEFEVFGHSNLSFEAGFCSWYQPYHYLPRTKWGIHLSYHCWGQTSLRFSRNCPNLIDNTIDSVKAAFFFLYVHEVFHHIIENVASIIEIKLGDSSLYIDYLSNIYRQLFKTEGCLEECLANSYLFEMSDLCHIDRQYLKRELANQGEWCNTTIANVKEFRKSLDQLASQIATGQLFPVHSPILHTFQEVFENVSYSYFPRVPVWIHETPLPLR